MVTCIIGSWGCGGEDTTTDHRHKLGLEKNMAIGKEALMVTVATSLVPLVDGK